MHLRRRLSKVPTTGIDTGGGSTGQQPAETCHKKWRVTLGVLSGLAV